MSQTGTRQILLALSPELVDRELEIGAFLERFGFAVTTARGESECLACCGRTRFDALVFDVALCQDLGVEPWLEKLKIISPETAPVALGSSDSLDLLRRVCVAHDGDYVLLPLSLAELRTRLKRLVDLREQRSLGEGDRELEDTRSVDDIVGRSEATRAIRERIRKIAGLGSTVLITGESGVGKELIARAVHRASPRRERPFIALNCAAIPENLLESELFGHEKGAFTGAGALYKGKFELAHQGTLFLDEIGDMNPYTQAKILRVLEEREFMRVGGSRNVRVDVRVLAATNAMLPRRIAEGRFREDLYYRLKVITIDVPPLRARSEDVPELARAFVDRFCRSNGSSPKRVTDEALARLRSYHWPGNVRELRNTIESAVAMAPGAVIDVDDLPEEVRSDPASRLRAGLGGGLAGNDALAPGAGLTPADPPVAGSMEQMERELIRGTLAEVGGNRTRAARLLKIGVRTLQRKIKRFGLEDDGDRDLAAQVDHDARRGHREREES